MMSPRRPARRRPGHAAAVLLACLACLVAATTAGTVAGAAPAAAEPGRLGYPQVAVSRAPGLVVGLGDSVPAGTNCHCTAYVGLLAQAVAGDDVRAARVRSLALGGATTSSVLAQLGRADVRQSLASASVVVVTVGANDLSSSSLADPRCRPVTALACYRAALAAIGTRTDRLLGQLAGLVGPGARVLVTGYWNVFLDGAVGRRQGSDYVTGSDALTRAENALLAASAGRAHLQYVDIYTPFKGSGNVDCTPLLAADGDHPNARGHRVIADTLLGALRVGSGGAGPDGDAAG